MFFMILAWVLRVYMMILWARFIVEWVRVLQPGFKPRGVLLMLVETVYTVTDPPIKLARKLIKPIRVGQIMLDVSMILVLFVVWALIQLCYIWHRIFLSESAYTAML